MASFFQQDPQNPYLPSGGQQLAQMLMSLGAGFSMAGANNQPWWAGIAPGAAMYGQAQQQAQQNALAMQQRDENLAYRKLQEEALRAQIDDSKRQADLDASLMPQLGRLVGGQVGMGVPPKPATMGGGQNVNPNNIGNVRPVGGGPDSGFQQPASFEDGVRLAVGNAQAYPAAFNNGQPMSLLQIGERWAPKGDGANDPAAWARNVASIGGLPVDQPLDLSNPQIAAMFARGVHGAEHGAGAVRPLADYMPGAAGGRVQPVQYQQGANPQITPQGVMPPRVDPAQGLPFLLSKKLAPVGKGIIDWGNTEATRYAQDQDRAQKERQWLADFQLKGAEFANRMAIQREEQDRANANAKVDPKTGQPTQGVIDAEAQTAAAQEKAKREAAIPYAAAEKMTAAEMDRYSKDVRPGVEATAASLPNLYEMKRLASGDMAAGTMIDARMMGARVLDTLGIQKMPDGMVNTTEFLNRASKNVLSFLQTRALGSGSGISEGDRKFVEQMGAKDAGYSKPELQRLTDIAIQSAQNDLKKHDATVGRLKALPGVNQIGDGFWKIDAPSYDEWAKANPPQANNPAPASAAAPNVGPAAAQTPQLPPPPGGFDPNFDYRVSPDGKSWQRKRKQ